MTRLKVGAVSYLNTKPLIARLPELAPDIDLRLAVPSRLADELAAGDLDVGLIPAVEIFRHGGYTVVPGVCIGSRGPVLSVRLLSHVPWGQVRRLAVDAGSRTSVALSLLLLEELFRVRPETAILPLEADWRDAEADAALLIGDRAMRVPEGEAPFALDLGDEWTRWTGLPFVWAAWAVRPEIRLPAASADAFRLARALAEPDLLRLAAAEADRLGLDRAQCEHYLTHAIRHALGPAELAGLERFRRLAGERGLAPQGDPIAFHHPRDPVARG